MVPCHKHEDVVDVDFNLPDQFDLKDYVIVYGIDNGVGVEFVSKGLWCGAHQWISPAPRIGGKDRCTGKAEQMVVLE